jgi:glycosyltransferase involved in cell wall biosynthesis
MNVLHVSPAFYPATYWGGPIFSVYGLCNALATLPGVELRVLTTDTAGPHRYQKVEVAQLPMRYPSGYEVYFTRRLAGTSVAPGLLMRLLAMIRWADVVHLTAIYSFPTIPTLFVCRLLEKPLVWSPRGALQATEDWNGASKRKLKGIWERICSVAMPKQCVLHVTSEKERAASAARMPNAATVVIPNGTDIPESLPARQWRPGAMLRLLYLGRLHPSKGIENLLQALSQIDDDAVTLDVYGAGESRYARSLVSMADQLGLKQRVRFRGRVEAEEKTKAFLGADICVLPSYSENFGMVVAEALAHGLPVIASQCTPWGEIEDHACGLCVDNSPETLAKAIRRMRECDLGAMGSRGRQWMKVAFSWDDVAKRMNDLYRSMAR